MTFGRFSASNRRKRSKVGVLEGLLGVFRSFLVQPPVHVRGWTIVTLSFVMDDAWVGEGELLFRVFEVVFGASALCAC